MIEFKYRYCKRDRTPVVTDLAIQDYAEALLQDYKPQLLKEAGQIKGIHFLESYLGANVDFTDLYCREGTKIAGATVFTDENILIFDRENFCIRPIPVKAGTVMIDNSTMDQSSFGFALFTQLHEGGHFCMHREVYTKKASEKSKLFAGEEFDGHIAQCTRSMIEQPRKQLVTDLDFREHQANTFAAAIAMPRPVFIPLAQELIRNEGMPAGIWYQPEWYDPGYNYLELQNVIIELSRTFGVSPKAVRVQLQRQGLLKTIKRNR